MAVIGDAEQEYKPQKKKTSSDEDDKGRKKIVPESLMNALMRPGGGDTRPADGDQWATFLDSEGRLMDSEALRKINFYGGVEHNLRKEVWSFLLEYHPYDSTYAEREYLVAVKKSEYETIKSQWQSITPEQAKRFTKFR